MIKITSYGVQLSHSALNHGESEDFACGAMQGTVTVTCTGSIITQSGFCMDHWTRMEQDGMCMSDILTFAPHYTKMGDITTQQCRDHCVTSFLSYLPSNWTRN